MGRKEREPRETKKVVHGESRDTKPVRKKYHFEFKNTAQKMAWTAFEQHEVTFLLGKAGTGKSFLAVAYAIREILERRKEKIILTRPIVEAGESLGFLPGTFEEKVNPYMMPMYDCITKMVGKEGPDKERVYNALEVAPLAYLRGRTFENAVCIFDEAQNASYMQLKLFLSRFGENSRVIVNGDPEQSDLRGDVALVEVVKRLETEPGIGIVEFKACSIVRHPLIGRILDRLA